MIEQQVEMARSKLAPEKYSKLIFALSGANFNGEEIREILLNNPNIDNLKLNESMGTFFEEVVGKNKGDLFAFLTRAIPIERLAPLIKKEFYSLSNEFINTINTNICHSNEGRKEIAKLIAEARDYSGRTAFYYTDHAQEKARIHMILKVFRAALIGEDLTANLLACLEVTAGNFGKAFEWLKVIIDLLS